MAQHATELSRFVIVIYVKLYSVVAPGILAFAHGLHSVHFIKSEVIYIGLPQVLWAKSTPAGTSSAVVNGAYLGVNLRKSPIPHLRIMLMANPAGLLDI